MSSLFIPLEEFTEELLSLHEAEILHLKRHYEEHQELFEGVHRWENSWRLFLELEVSSTMTPLGLALQRHRAGRVRPV